ncbi:MAG: biopolymer transporter ExbD [Pirellulaceae bacterium]|nr:biopolymer transporter ExbD [Pirellulaceae bacterium]
MRRPSPFARRESLEIKMTPMIDVVFLLLVFFVWTASFQVVEYLLPSELSTLPGNQAALEEPPPEADFEDVVIRIHWAGDQPGWTVNEQQADSLAQLQQRLQAIAQVKQDAPVILHPDEEVPLGDVINVFDLSRLVGFEKIQFVAGESL